MFDSVPSLEFCRSEFPALTMDVNGHTPVFLDGPGGTQVPQRVIDAVSAYLAFENANVHGAFRTSEATDRVLSRGREAVAALLNCDGGEVAFGANMTTLNYALSRALARKMTAGDEVIITKLDHEGNRGPWLALAEDGIVVHEVEVNLETLTLELDDLRDKLTSKTRVVAVGGASNATGTVNDIRQIIELAHEVGATCVVDGVHLVPHKPVDVREIGCDYLLCSAYKFFGPHVGILYGKLDAFSDLETYKLRPQLNDVPFRIETGTLNHEGIAGVEAAVQFVASIGHRVAADRSESLRSAVVAGMQAIDAYEQELGAWFESELRLIPGLRLYAPPPGYPRTPTFSFTLETMRPRQIAEALGKVGIFSWDGDFYATTLIDELGLQDSGGVLRLGLAPYNTRSELEHTLEVLQDLAE